MTGATWDPWSYRGSAEERLGDSALVGFTVQTLDGDVGKVDVETNDVGASYVVVDTGPWIFGRKVLLPAGTIERVDWSAQEVHVDLTKEQLESSPPEPSTGWSDPDYRGEVATYYGTLYQRPPLA